MATDTDWNLAGSSTASIISTAGAALPPLKAVADTIADQVTGTTPENPLHLAVENTQTQLTLTNTTVNSIASALTSQGTTLEDFIARWTSGGDLDTWHTDLQTAVNASRETIADLFLLINWLASSLESSFTDGNPLDWWDSQVAAGRIVQSAGIIAKRVITGEGGGTYLHLNPYWFYERDSEGAAVPVPTKVGALLRDFCANYQFTPMSGGDPHSTLGFLVIVASLLPVQY